MLALPWPCSVLNSSDHQAKQDGETTPREPHSNQGNSSSRQVMYIKDSEFSLPADALDVVYINVLVVTAILLISILVELDIVIHALVSVSGSPSVSLVLLHRKTKSSHMDELEKEPRTCRSR